MVNGAGLAMASTISQAARRAADWRDAAAARRASASRLPSKLILENPKVKAILVNIFGGIVRCDTIAEGVIGAARDIGIQGRELLAKSGLALTAATDLTDAAKKVVAAARGPR